MSTVAVMEPVRKDQAINEAVCRSVPVILSIKDGNAWSVHKSTFLGIVPSPDRLIVQYPEPPNPGAGLPDIHVGEHIGVAFRRGHKKCVFTSVVLDTGDHGPEPGPTARTLTLSWPDIVQELQRRAYDRVPVPAHKNVAIEIWQGGAVNRKKAGTAAWPSYTGRLIDLSAGGVRLVLPPNQSLKPNVNDVVGLEFQPEPAGPAFLLNGILRHATPNADGSLAVGIQLTGLEATADGRQVLQQLLRVINQYQRCELRRTRFAGQPA